MRDNSNLVALFSYISPEISNEILRQKRKLAEIFSVGVSIDPVDIFSFNEG
jgi:hypothetical protein